MGKKTLAEKILEHTQPVPFSGCLIWLGSLTNGGYGKASFGRAHIKAHRAAWISAHGSIPDGKFVLHKCDIRCCVNTDHLFIGDQSDNMLDMWRKKRRKPFNMFGENHYLAKLSDNSVRVIRNDTRPLKVIADEYGVTRSVISNILNRKTWKHVED